MARPIRMRRADLSTDPVFWPWRSPTHLRRHNLAKPWLMSLAEASARTYISPVLDRGTRTARVSLLANLLATTMAGRGSTPPAAVRSR